MFKHCNYQNSIDMWSLVVYFYLCGVIRITRKIVRRLHDQAEESKSLIH